MHAVVRKVSGCFLCWTLQHHLCLMYPHEETFLALVNWKHQRGWLWWRGGNQSETWSIHLYCGDRHQLYCVSFFLPSHAAAGLRLSSWLLKGNIKSLFKQFPASDIVSNIGCWKSHSCGGSAFSISVFNASALFSTIHTCTASKVQWHIINVASEEEKYFNITAYSYDTNCSLKDDRLTNVGTDRWSDTTAVNTAADLFEWHTHSFAYFWW